jgi:hypothetical protein
MYTSCTHEYTWAWEARPDKPGPARKSQAWAVFFGPMGGPGQQKCGPTAYSGRAWVADSEVFGKARPESPTENSSLRPGLGRFFRPDSRAGPGLGSHFQFRALSWPGPTRPGPRGCPGIHMNSCVFCCEVGSITLSFNWKILNFVW